MNHKYIVVSNTDELYHHGIKGQKWGRRRFQNEDGSLTPEGVKRYQVDQYGNMTKRGAANYYRDLYNEAKATGYKGQGVHDRVRQNFNSEEEYQAFLKNYRDYKGKKAVRGAVLGTAGVIGTTALLGAGAIAGGRALAKGQRRLVNNAILKGTNAGQRFQNMNTQQLMEYSKSQKHLGSNLKESVQNIVNSKLAERAAEENLIRASKGHKQLYNHLNTEDLRNVLERKYNNLNQYTGSSKVDKMYRKYSEKDLKVAEKAYAKQAKKEYFTNIKLAGMDQAKVETGKDAIQNRMNAFSNSYFGQIASGAGTVVGAAVINAGAESTRRALSNMYDPDTANRIVPNSLKIKEYKDRSSVLTMPQRMDKNWSNASKPNSQGYSNNSDDDDDEDDEEKRKKNN